MATLSAPVVQRPRAASAPVQAPEPPRLSEAQVKALKEATSGATSKGVDMAAMKKRQAEMAEQMKRLAKLQESGAAPDSSLAGVLNRIVTGKDPRKTA